eukprot:355364-Chlamydomonas_euryale.AAC.5
MENRRSGLRARRKDCRPREAGHMLVIVVTVASCQLSEPAWLPKGRQQRLARGPKELALRRSPRRTCLIATGALSTPSAHPAAVAMATSTDELAEQDFKLALANKASADVSA